MMPDKLPDIKEIAAAPRKMSKAQNTALVANPCDEDGHAQTFIALYNDVRYNEAWGWTVWNGKFWEKKQAHVVKNRIRRMLIDRATAGEAVNDVSLAKIRPTLTVVNKVFGVLEYMPDLRADVSEFDAHPYLLNVANGIIDLRSGELLPHDKSFLLSHYTDIEYDTDASYVDWDLFFTENVTQDKEYLQIATGYSLTGDVSEEVMFYVYGPSRSGKGTFTEGLLKILPQPLSIETDFNTFTRDRSNDPNNFDLAPLKSSRLIIASESEKHDRLNPAKIKILTGGNMVYCSHKGRDHFSYKPQYKIWLVSNHPVTADPDDDAIWGRIRVIIFPQSHLGTENRNLKRKLHSTDSLKGLLLWAVEGAVKWYKLSGSGIPISETMEDIRAEMRRQADTVGQFMEDCCRAVDPDRHVTNAELYKAYSEWCKENGYKARTVRNMIDSIVRRDGFGRAIRKVDFKTQRVITGLVLND